MIYLKNNITEEIITFENENQIGIGFSDWEIMSQSAINLILLDKIKNNMIFQLKKNRDAANIKPMSSHQAKEIVFDDGEYIVTEEDVYFKFKLDPTGFSVTEPATICLGVLLASFSNPAFYTRYSCEIIEGETIRKGYVQIDGALAASILGHGAIRIPENTSRCNDIEAQINAINIIENDEEPENNVTYAEALEALSLIDITFE